LGAAIPIASRDPTAMPSLANFFCIEVIALASCASVMFHFSDNLPSSFASAAPSTLLWASMPSSRVCMARK
jgi:hypothetical protein